MQEFKKASLRKDRKLLKREKNEEKEKNDLKSEMFDWFHPIRVDISSLVPI